jgi:hypothetical protein
MADIADTIRPAPANVRTVQEYIDEVPAWADGTSVKSTPMTGMHGEFGPSPQPENSSRLRRVHDRRGVAADRP